MTRKKAIDPFVRRTPSTTNGQFTFNYGEMKGYMGNGSTAPQAYIAFVGECVTNGSSVTSSGGGGDVDGRPFRRRPRRPRNHR